MCMNILKKAIVMLPVLIMLVIFLIRVTLTHKPEEENDLAGNVTVVSSFARQSDNADVNHNRSVTDKSIILDSIRGSKGEEKETDVR